MKVNPGLLLGGILSVVFLIVMLIKGWLIVMTFITVLYPAVHSIRAIESSEEEDEMNSSLDTELEKQSMLAVREKH